MRGCECLCGMRAKMRGVRCPQAKQERRRCGPLRALALTGCRPPAMRSVTQRWDGSESAGSRFCCSPLAPLRRRLHPVQGPRGAGRRARRPRRRVMIRGDSSDVWICIIAIASLVPRRDRRARAQGRSPDQSSKGQRPRPPAWAGRRSSQVSLVRAKLRQRPRPPAWAGRRSSQVRAKLRQRSRPPSKGRSPERPSKG